MPAIINIALRGLQVSASTPPPPPSSARSRKLTTFHKQIFFAIVILGLSGHLVASQALGGAPSVTNYEVFLGIWLLVVSFLGLAAIKVDALAGIVGVALEGLTLLFTFAGGTVCVIVPRGCCYTKERSTDHQLYYRRWQPNSACTLAPALQTTKAVPTLSTTSLSTAVKTKPEPSI